MVNSVKNIFQYTNYREFLRDYYEERKKSEGYTYRDFAQASGMNSASWLMHLIKGRKNLSSESSARVAKAIQLNRPKSEYFGLMVEFTQAKSFEDKDKIYLRMIDLKKRLKVVSINEEQYEYYSKWYHPVIRSLVTKIDFNEDYAELGSHVVPEITAGQARKSVKLLERLGMLKKNSKGEWKQSRAVVSTGDEVDSLKIANYHKEVSQLASDVYERSTTEIKDISALTLGVSKEVSFQIKTEIQAFRKRLIQMAQSSEGADRVYQLNFQFFPTSKPKKEE